MSITITSPVPITLFPSTASTINDEFTFSYTVFGAFISPSGIVKIGIDSVVDPTTHKQYQIIFKADYVGLGYGGGSGEQQFSVQIPAEFFKLVQTAYVEYQVTLCELDPNTFAVTGVATESIDLFILGTATPPPPPPPKFTPEEKTQFKSDADTLNHLADALSDLGAATDPLHPAAKLAGSLASQLAAAVEPSVGKVNSVVQIAISVAAGAL